jgi:hypothetical protein
MEAARGQGIDAVSSYTPAVQQEILKEVKGQIFKT